MERIFLVCANLQLFKPRKDPQMQVLRWLWPHDEGVPHSEEENLETIVLWKNDASLKFFPNTYGAAGFTTYPSFERVAAEMTEMGLQEVYFAMYDVEAAFRQIRIHPDDWIYLVVAGQRTKNGEREWYIDLALPFGVVVGPKITLTQDFNLFGPDLLHFILQQTCFSSGDKELVAKMIRYLDDHLILGLGLMETNKLLDDLLAMMARLDIPVKDSKTVWPPMR